MTTVDEYNRKLKSAYEDRQLENRAQGYSGKC